MNTEENIHRVVALAGSEANTRPTGTRTGAKLAPVTPDPILLHLVGTLPHAMTFVAPLKGEDVRISAFDAFGIYFYMIRPKILLLVQPDVVGLVQPMFLL